MSPVVLNIEELTAILALAVKSNETTPGGTTTDAINDEETNVSSSILVKLA